VNSIAKFKTELRKRKDISQENEERNEREGLVVMMRAIVLLVNY
jgi:hypothetical protein